MTVRIGVIGCGDWGTNHARTLASLSALAAVADHDPARAAALAERFGCQALSVEAMLNDASIDGLVLALPPQYHVATALRVLGAGKHLLVEKPMALDVAGADAIVAAADAAAVVAMTGHVLRFHPAFEALERLVQGGVLGDLRYLGSRRTGLGKFFLDTDVLWDYAPHDLSLILALTGGRPSQTRFDTVAVATQSADIADLEIVFGSGVRAHCHVSRVSPLRERRLIVVGTAATAVFDDAEPWARKLALYRHPVWRDAGPMLRAGIEPQYQALPDTPPLEAELQHFMACIRDRLPPRSSAEEAREVLRVLAGRYHSGAAAESSRGIDAAAADRVVSH